MDNIKFIDLFNDKFYYLSVCVLYSCKTSPYQNSYTWGLFLMEKEKVLITNEEMNAIIERLSFQIIEKITDYENTYIVGIRRRGEFIADRILESMKKHNKKPLKSGVLDITLYRDDLTEISSMPEVKSSDIGFDVNDKTIILVDDVLYTGRTIRSALDALLDYGRPKKIMLAVMVDRGHRELPVSANFTGKYIPTRKSEVIHVKVKEIDNVDDCVTISDKGEI